MLRLSVRCPVVPLSVFSQRQKLPVRYIVSHIPCQLWSYEEKPAERRAMGTPRIVVTELEENMEINSMMSIPWIRSGDFIYMLYKFLSTPVKVEK